MLQSKLEQKKLQSLFKRGNRLPEYPCNTEIKTVCIEAQQNQSISVSVSEVGV